MERSNVVRAVFSGSPQEIAWPSAGIRSDDPRGEECFALAEESDVPTGIHPDVGLRGADDFGCRASASHPLFLEELLPRHPDVRGYLMRAGWPFVDESIALAQVRREGYADLSSPRERHRPLRSRRHPSVRSPLDFIRRVPLNADGRADGAKAGMSVPVRLRG